MADLDRELARRVRSITHHVAFDRLAFEPVLGRAAVEAQLEARRFAELIGIAPLQPSRLAAEDFFAVGDRRNPFSSFDVMESQGIDYGDVVSGSQSVRVRTAVVQAGSRTVAPTVVQTLPIDAEFEGQAVALADWPDIHATIEADRPELFVAAGTDEDSVLAAGRVPEQLALAYARTRADMFASLLGARLGIVSMVVLPRVAEQFSGVRIRSLGLAMTMEPPDPLSSVVRNAATPSPAPRAAPASPLPFAPIEVAGPDSTITTRARAELPVAPDGLRVEVTVAPTRDAPNQATVLAQLKSDPMVSDLAVDGGASSDARVIYSVVLRSAAAPDRARIVDLIRGAYGASARTLNTVETRLIRDCRLLERRIVADAIGQARAQAGARAAASHVRLSRLLLAVELPFGADFDGCFDHAAAPELRSLPGYASLDELHVWGAVSLTFRTQPER